MWMMGHLYESGIGVKRDFKAARSWYEKAAATGEPDGMMSLGIDLMRGNQQDARKGFEWLERAANTTNANAVAELGYAYYKGIYWQRSDKTKGLQLLEQAKLNGSGRAHLYLGYIRSDPKSTHLNYVQARLDFEEAALRGYEAGLLWHGNLLWRGQGGPEDKVTATKLYERGAIKGNLVCMRNLATSYSSELNSPIKAAEWYKRAGDRGFYESYQALSLLYLEGKLGSGRNADGIRYMRLAHENGVIEATFLLGTYYEFGKYGLKQDLGEAREFYFKAADAGNEDAKTALKRLQNP